MVVPIVPDSESAVLADLKSPAGNGLRHVGADARTAAIRRTLNSVFEPQTDAESACVAELARERARLAELEAAHGRCVEDEKRRAVELFERRSRDLFRADLNAWQDDPHGMMPILESTWHGVAYLADLWAAIVASLLPGGPGPTFGQMRQAVLAQGSPWRADRIGLEQGHLLACYLKMRRDGCIRIEKWIAASPDADRTDAAERARWFVEQAPDAAVARQEIAELAQAESHRWSLREKELRAGYETARAAAVERAVGIGLGDKTLANELRILNRSLAMTRSRIDKMERRLDAMRKTRSVGTATADQRPTRLAKPGVEPRDDRQPNAFSTCGATNGMPQHEPVQTDAFALRNGATTVSGPSATADEEAPHVRSAARRALSRIRRAGGREANRLEPSDIAMLRKIESLEAGKDRDALIRATFGSEAKFRRCLKAVSAAAGPSECDDAKPGWSRTAP